MVYSSIDAYAERARALRVYVMNHDDETERRVLGEQCRNALHGGQVVVTMPAEIS